MQRDERYQTDLSYLRRDLRQQHAHRRRVDWGIVIAWGLLAATILYFGAHLALHILGG